MDPFTPPAGWYLYVRHWRWYFLDDQGRVLYWIHTAAVGGPLDNREGFVADTGERIPPLPEEAYHGGC